MHSASRSRPPSQSRPLHGPGHPHGHGHPHAPGQNYSPADPTDTTNQQPPAAVIESPPVDVSCLSSEPFNLCSHQLYPMLDYTVKKTIETLESLPYQQEHQQKQDEPQQHDESEAKGAEEEEEPENNVAVDFSPVDLSPPVVTENSHQTFINEKPEAPASSSKQATAALSENQPAPSQQPKSFGRNDDCLPRPLSNDLLLLPKEILNIPTYHHRPNNIIPPTTSSPLLYEESNQPITHNFAPLTTAQNETELKPSPTAQENEKSCHQGKPSGLQPSRRGTFENIIFQEENAKKEFDLRDIRSDYQLQSLRDLTTVPAMQYPATPMPSCANYSTIASIPPFSEPSQSLICETAQVELSQGTSIINQTSAAGGHGAPGGYLGSGTEMSDFMNTCGCPIDACECQSAPGSQYQITNHMKGPIGGKIEITLTMIPDGGSRKTNLMRIPKISIHPTPQTLLLNGKRVD